MQLAPTYRILELFKDAFSPWKVNENLKEGSSGRFRISIFRNPSFVDGGSEPRWLVFANGKSRTAADVIINTAFDPSVEPLGNEGDAVYVCSGCLRWSGQKAYIN